MAAHTMQEFQHFMSQLQTTNQSLDFFCDFKKIEQRVAEVKLSLCMLNSLIGARDLRQAVETIWRRDSSAFRVMDILIAVRSEGKKPVLNSLNQCILIDHLFTSMDGVMEFLTDTGLAAILQERKVTNLVDYVFGIETGLDSNARKNRSGHVMEDVVGRILSEHGIEHRREVYSSEWPILASALGDDEKRFDYVFHHGRTTYLMEVNFYSGGGSKLNEVARSYSDIAPKINQIEGFEFVWVTDGVGWQSARNKLQEAYSIIPHIYNLTNIHKFLNSLQ